MSTGVVIGRTGYTKTQRRCFNNVCVVNVDVVGMSRGSREMSSVIEMSEVSTDTQTHAYPNIRPVILNTNLIVRTGHCRVACYTSTGYELDNVFMAASLLSCSQLVDLVDMFG